MCFFLHRLAILQLVDLPWFPWLSIPGSTMEVRIIIPFASEASFHFFVGSAMPTRIVELQELLAVSGERTLVTIWINLVCKEMAMITQILVGILLFILMGFWILLGFVWSNLRYIEGQGHSCERDALSQAFHCPLVRFLGLSSQNLLFYNNTHFVELELVVLRVAYTKKAFIDQKWFMPCWTLPQCRRRGRKVEEWMLFSRVSREHSHMLQDRFSTTSTGLIKWL